MTRPLVHLVIVEGPLHVLAAYTRVTVADVHSRTVTGASVITIELLDQLPEVVREMIFDEFEEDDDTPVDDLAITIDPPSPRHR